MKTVVRRITEPAPPPLLRTFTRIIGVVPGPVRILIAVLAAFALGLGARSSLTAVRARRLERQRRELMADVGLLQAALLPEIPERIGTVRTSVAYEPADGPAAGGDFYDAFELEDGRLGIIIGDLSGHGRRALPHTALVRFTLRAHLEAGLSPKHAIQSAAPILDRQLGEPFATVVMAAYDPERRQLVYASAGHPAPVILGPSAVTPITVCCSPPIGVAMPTGTRQTTVQLPGEALICFYTDGVVEARKDGALLGVGWLERALSELGPGTSARALLEKVDAETDARPDDMAACLLTLDGESAAPRVVAEEMELCEPDLAEQQIEHFLVACGIGRDQIAETKRQAMSCLLRDRSLVIEVSWESEQPTVSVHPGEVSFFKRTASRARERRRMAQ